MSFRFSQGVGRIIDGTNTGLRVSSKIEALYEADAAIRPANLVMLDTGDQQGRLAVVATLALDHKVIGVYEGSTDKGGSGDNTTLTGYFDGLNGNKTISGKNAADGDIIWVTVYGRALVLVGGSTTAVADGDVLIVDVFLTAGGGTNAGLIVGTAPTAPVLAPFLALAAVATNNTGSAVGVFIRCM